MGSDEANDPVLKLREGEVVWRDFGGETVLLDLRTSRYLTTNASATLLWRRLEAGATRAQLVDALVETFAIDPDRAEEDIDGFVNDCRRRGLLDEGAGSG